MSRVEDDVKQGKAFMFTWNNPDREPEFPEGSRYVYQKERGKEGTVHYQGYVTFSSNKTLAALKKLIPEAHWENRKGNHKQAYEYVTKEETRIEEPKGNMQPVQRAGKRTDLEEARMLVIEHGNYRDCVNDSRLDEVRAKYPNWIKELLAANFTLNSDFVPRLWQQELLDMLIVPCKDDRTIHWYYDEVGKSGKTVFGKYLVTNYKALYLTNGKTADAACIYDGQPIVVFNYTRSQSERINYEILETVKDGIMMSGKYQPVQKVHPSPHVVVFANFLPNESMLSADRWNIVDMASRKRKHLKLEPQGLNVYKGSYVEGYTPGCRSSVPAEEIPKFTVVDGELRRKEKEKEKNAMEVEEISEYVRKKYKEI